MPRNDPSYIDGGSFLLAGVCALLRAAGSGLRLGCFLTCSKYCCTYCCRISGTSSRLISPPASACVALDCEYGVCSLCSLDGTSTVISPVMLAERLPIISLILPIAATCSASLVSLLPSWRPIPLPG